MYYGITQRKKNSVDEFLVAGRDMPILPVSLSLVVSWVSAISFIGDPVEVYTYGVIYCVIGLGYIISLPVVAHAFAPVFHELQVISVFEVQLSFV